MKAKLSTSIYVHAQCRPSEMLRIAIIVANTQGRLSQQINNIIICIQSTIKSGSLAMPAREDVTLMEALADIEARFIIPLPASELRPERVFFHLEQAHWFYEVRRILLRKV